MGSRLEDFEGDDDDDDGGDEEDEEEEEEEEHDGGASATTIKSQNAREIPANAMASAATSHKSSKESVNSSAESYSKKASPRSSAKQSVNTSITSLRPASVQNVESEKTREAEAVNQTTRSPLRPSVKPSAETVKTYGGVHFDKQDTVAPDYEPSTQHSRVYGVGQKASYSVNKQDTVAPEYDEPSTQHSRRSTIKSLAARYERRADGHDRPARFESDAGNHANSSSCRLE